MSYEIVTLVCPSFPVQDANPYQDTNSAKAECSNIFKLWMRNNTGAISFYLWILSWVNIRFRRCSTTMDTCFPSLKLSQIICDIGDPDIMENTGESYTKLTYWPDLDIFGMRGGSRRTQFPSCIGKFTTWRQCMENMYYFVWMEICWTKASTDEILPGTYTRWSN